jgi:hypothetical protein
MRRAFTLFLVVLAKVFAFRIRITRLVAQQLPKSLKGNSISLIRLNYLKFACSQ